MAFAHFGISDLISAAKSAGEPALHEDRRDAIAHLHARDAGAGFHNFAGAVRKRNHPRIDRAPLIGAGGDLEVAVIE